MSGKVYGLYNTQDAVSEAIRQLKKEGYEGQNITVMANSEEKLAPEKAEEVDFMVLDRDDADNAFFDSIKKFFGLDARNDIEESLNSLSLSAEKKEAYLKQIEEGFVLIVLNKNDEWGPDLNDSSYEGEDRDVSPFNPNINLYRGL